MARDKDDKSEGGEFWIEFQRDFGYRGAHLGSGFIMDGNEDRAWAEHICLDGNLAKRVPKPDVIPPKPWEEAPAPVDFTGAKQHPTQHPTAPKAFGNAPAKK